MALTAKERAEAELSRANAEVDRLETRFTAAVEKRTAAIQAATALELQLGEATAVRDHIAAHPLLRVPEAIGD